MNGQVGSAVFSYFFSATGHVELADAGDLE